jgi:hypothetical protein
MEHYFAHAAWPIIVIHYYLSNKHSSREKSSISESVLEIDDKIPVKTGIFKKSPVKILRSRLFFWKILSLYNGFLSGKIFDDSGQSKLLNPTSGPPVRY